MNPDQLFDLLVDLLAKDYVLGAATIGNVAKNEVGGHAYATLGAYNVELDDGQKVKLVRYFNPWHSEVWKNNSWGDDSKNWTDKVKAQVPYLTGNDGVVFSTIEDYHSNFGVTNWAEIQDDFDISFIDLAMNDDDLLLHDFETQFYYGGSNQRPLYIFNDQSNGRLLMGCTNPLSVSSIIVIDPSGKSTTVNEDQVKIDRPEPGLYTVRIRAKKQHSYARYLTVTTYAMIDKVKFVPKENNEVKYYKKSCPNNCNFQGKCNTFSGECSCFFGVNFYFV